MRRYYDTMGAVTQEHVTIDRQALAERCLWIAEALARRAAGRNRDYEDVYGEACLAVTRAANAWPGRGKATTYVWLCVRRAVRAAVRKLARAQQVELLPELDDRESRCTPYGAPGAERLRKLLRRLPGDERAAAKVLLRSGLSMPARFLARKLGTTPHHAQRLRARALARLRALAQNP